MTSVKKIISGGQTGADRAGLDAAIELGIDYGGSIPAGRKTEDGTLPERYDKIIELESDSYAVRTEKNVVDADATLIFTYDKIGAGSALTAKLAQKHLKPCLHINLSDQRNEDVIEIISDWLNSAKPDILNVAGSRESTSEGIYNTVYDILLKVFGGENTMKKDKKPKSYKQEIPADAVLVKEIGSICFYFSKVKHEFYMETAEYHAGPVVLSRTDIVELLNIYDKQSKEKEEELITDIEQEDDDGF